MTQIYKFCYYKYQQHGIQRSSHTAVQKTTTLNINILKTRFALNSLNILATTKAANEKYFINIPIIKEKGVQFKS